MRAAAETYTQLMTNMPHLEFEVTLTLIQDVLIGVVLWPWIKKLVRRHDRNTHKIRLRDELDCGCIGPSHREGCPLKPSEPPY